MNILLFWLLAIVAVAVSGYCMRRTPIARRIGTFIGDLVARYGNQIQKLGSVIRSNFYENRNAFSDLAPSDDTDPKHIYEKRLEYAIHAHNIKNVALTGPYGSGKSSILLTFQKRHPEFKYLSISLTPFKGDDVPDEKRNEVIELSILQQIFYHVRHKDIPGSRFKRIKRQSRPLLYFRTFCIMLFLASVAFILKRNQTLSTLNLIDFAKDHPKVIPWIEIISIILTPFFLIYTTLKIYSNSKLHKLSLSSGEVELAAEDLSALNKHLDEILYFFEATKFSVVIFEDLDRFENPDIFTKLREINALLNNSRQINRKITFIYALKDEMFDNESRTKFFDFIIPVIPVISSLNSADILIQKITSLKLIEQITPQFLRNISLFIDDMRLLKNIFNEFELYDEQFDESGIKAINLFSIVLYKNTYPHDFALLQNDQGTASQIFRQKVQFIQALIEEKNKSLLVINDQILKLEKSIAEDINELRLIYIGALVTKLPANCTTAVQLHGAHVWIPDLTNTENFQKLQSQPNIQYRHPNGAFHNSGLSFSAIEQSVNPTTTYLEREELLRNGKQRAIEHLKTEKETLQYEISQIRSYSMQQIMAATNIVATQPDLKKNELLSYLIKNGYIDEQFRFYAAHFYEGTLTKNDLAFILSVKKDTPLPFAAPLDKIENVITYLSPLDFGSEAILNFQLTNYLLANSEKHQDHWLALLKHMSNEQPLTIEYYEQYLNNGSEIATFVVDLENRYWPDQCDFILNRSGYSTTKKDFHLKVLLKYYSLEQIESSEKLANISAYLKDRKDFLSFASNLEPGKINAIIKTLGIHFTKLKDTEDSKDVLLFIYENSYYSISQEMIQLMLDVYGKNEYRQAETYDSIQRSGCTSLINYIDDNFTSFINDVYLTHPSYRSEPENSLIQMLQRDSIDQAIKENILSASKTAISDLTSIENVLWPEAIIAKRAKVSWPNLIHYKKQYGFDDDLIAYLNDKAIQNDLTIQTLDIPEIPDDAMQDFVLDLFKTPQIDEAIISAVAHNYPYSFEHIDMASITSERLKTLILENTIALSPENFKSLSQKENPDNLKLILILQHQQIFISTIDQYPLNAKIVANIIANQGFPSTDKLMILNTLNPDDIIEANANELSNSIFRQKLAPKPELIEKLLSATTNKSLAISLLASSHSKIKAELIPNYIHVMGEPYSNILSSETAALDANESHEQLLQFLKNNNLIASFKKEKKILIVTPLNPPVDQS